MPPVVSSNEQFLANEVERLQKELAELKVNGNSNKDKRNLTEETREVEEPADSNLVHTNIDTFLEENSISEETEEEIEDGDGFDPLGGSTGEQKKMPVGNFEDPDCSQTALHFEEVSPNSQISDVDRNDAKKDENVLQTMEEDGSDVKIEIPVQHFDNHNGSGSIGAAGDISGNEERYEECASDMSSSETAADKAADGVEEKINLQDFEEYAEVGETQEVSALESGKGGVDSLEKTDYPLCSYAIEEVNHVISAVTSSLPDVDGLDAVADPVACTAIDNMENAVSEENEQAESHQIARASDVAHEESTGGVCFEEKYFASEQISVLKTDNEYCDPTSSSDTDGTGGHAMELEATIPDATLALEIDDGGQKAEAKLVLGGQGEEWEGLCANGSDDLSATLRDEEKSAILTTSAEDKQFLTGTAKRWEATASFDTEEKEQQVADAQAKASDETFDSDFEGKSQKAEETNALDEEGQDQKADDSDAHCTNLCDQEEGAVSSLEAEDEEHLVDSTERSREIQQPLDANTSNILVLNDFQETTNNYPADDLDGDPLEFRSGHVADELNGHEDAMLDDMTVATAETSLNAEESADLEIDRVESGIVTLGESCAVLLSACGNVEATEAKKIENLCVGASYEVEQLKLEETRMGNRSSEAETSKDQSDDSALITATAGANSGERLQGKERSETPKAAMHDPRLENPVFEESNTRDGFDGFVNDKAVRMPDAEQKYADEAFQKGVDETDAEQCGLIFYNDGKVCDGVSECLTDNLRLEQDVQEKIVGFVASNFVTKTIRKGIHHAVVMNSYNRKYMTKTFVSAVESAALRSVVVQLMRPRTPDAVMKPEQSSSSEILPVVELEAFENREVDVSHQKDDTICGTLVIDSLDSQPASESALDEDLLTQSDANEYDFASGTTENDMMLPNDKVTSSSDRSPLTSTENDQLCVADDEESGKRSEFQQNCGPVQDYFNDETEAEFVVTSADDDLGLVPSQILQPKNSDIMPSVASDEWSNVNELVLCPKEANISDTASKSFVEAFILEVQDEAVSRIVANHDVLHFVKKYASANDGLPVRNFERPEAEGGFSSNAKEDCSSLLHAHDAPESSQSETLDQDNLEPNDESAANEKGDVSRNAPDITIEDCAVRLPESIDQESNVVESAVESEVGNVDDTTRPNAPGFDAVEFINVVESEAIAAIIKSAASTLDVIKFETTIEAEVVLSSQPTHEYIQPEPSAVVAEVGSPKTEETRSVTETPTMNSSNHASTPQSDEGMAAEADDSALEFAMEAHAANSAVVNHEEMTPRRCSSPDVVATGEDGDCVVNARVVVSEMSTIVPTMDDLCCDIEKKATICDGAKDSIMRGHILESSSVSVEKDEDQHLKISSVEVVASDGERTEVEGMADCDVEDGISTCHADDVAQISLLMPEYRCGER
uniref:Uncharacterized protein n=1 Tax=Globisporangium ultimum (strain ATCC 200006 / CBS 805.95 / DAOM BR144) TaxID=431595 RepID=K3WA26_GLOUD